MKCVCGVWSVCPQLLCPITVEQLVRGQLRWEGSVGSCKSEVWNSWAVAVSWGRAGKQVGWCHMCHPHPLLAVRPEKIPNKNTTTNQPHLSFTPHCLSMKGNWILWFIISSRLNDQLPVDTICEICLTSDIIFVKDMIQICDEPLIWRKILSIMRSNWSEGALQMSNCLVNLRNLVFF